jgi:hypothetical protein
MADMDPHTSEKTIGELTWRPRHRDNNRRSKTKRRGNDNGKHTRDPPVPLSHGIYPNAYRISTRTRFESERMAGP